MFFHAHIDQDRNPWSGRVAVDGMVIAGDFLQIVRLGTSLSSIYYEDLGNTGEIGLPRAILDVDRDHFVDEGLAIAALHGTCAMPVT